jgi:hypothetical protein
VVGTDVAVDGGVVGVPVGAVVPDVVAIAGISTCSLAGGGAAPAPDDPPDPLVAICPPHAPTDITPDITIAASARHPR